MSKAVAKKESTEMVLADEMAELEGFGTEFEKDELAIPFLSVLQSMSPQVKKSDERYVDGAEEGHLFHTVLNRTFSKVYFIPCRFQHVVLQWKNRDTGGGLVASFEAGDPAIPAASQQERFMVVDDAPDTVLETTLQYVSLLFDEDMQPLGPGVISFKSSQLKYARRFNAALQARMLTRSDGSTFKAPIFSHVYSLQTFPERNDMGSWFSYKIGEGSVVSDSGMLRQALEFAKALREEKKVFVDNAVSDKSDESDESETLDI
jgi:hypothetical protein